MKTIVFMRSYPSCHSFSLASISASFIETSRVKSGQRTCPEASVTTLNRFWQSFRHAQIEQYFFSDDMAFPSRRYLSEKKLALPPPALQDKTPPLAPKSKLIDYLVNKNNSFTRKTRCSLRRLILSPVYPDAPMKSRKLTAKSHLFNMDVFVINRQNRHTSKAGIHNYLKTPNFVFRQDKARNFYGSM
jgi:hypothetical protein